MSSKPTITQVAELSGVSIASVSRYINNPDSVRDKTAKKIQSAIDELNYPMRFNSEESNPENNMKSKLILINVPSVSNPFYDDIIRGIRRVASKYGYFTLVNIHRTDTPSSETALLNILERISCSGIITLDAISKTLFDRLRQTLAFVQCCENTENQNTVPYVTIDDRAAITKIMDHLFSLGHEKIAFIGGPDKYKYSRHRREAYITALANAGFNIKPHWIYQAYDVDFDIALSAIRNLMSQGDRPTAVVTVSDVQAATVIRYCTANGLSVPDDIAVTGFDNISLSQVTSSTITTIDQPKYQMGQTACELLIERIEKPNCVTRQMILDTELIVREST